ncbi:Hypothetical protein, putative [Bodo saltans]|uniref:Uncharacterized protein n=1 Tax=Bodo saltans TaxID=75058 RepID=A0A0S4J0F6_BODSA|nr:Hypothetical protein, putative [Bodo saltans]|eukprot:CUG18988.1 Hypothetical protein, putative [Bodo saltans]
MGNACTRCCCDGPRVCYSGKGRRLSQFTTSQTSSSVMAVSTHNRTRSQSSGGARDRSPQPIPMVVTTEQRLQLLRMLIRDGSNHHQGANATTTTTAAHNPMAHPPRFALQMSENLIAAPESVMTNNLPSLVDSNDGSDNAVNRHSVASTSL